MIINFPGDYSPYFNEYTGLEQSSDLRSQNDNVDASIQGIIPGLVSDGFS